MKIDVDKFFENCIDGYLFSDLENMMTLGPIPKKKAGAVGYPILMTIMSGMELLGTLMQEVVLSTYANGSIKTGEDQFVQFWNNYLVKTNNKYKNMGSSVYNLARHGLAHQSMAKTGVIVTKQGDDPEYQMMIDKNSFENNAVYLLNINVIKLFNDFKESYKTFSEQRRVEPLKQRVEDRLNQIINADITMSNIELAPHYHSLSTIQSNSPTSTSSTSSSAGRVGSRTTLRPVIPSEAD